MWEAFERMAAQNLPGGKLAPEFQATYYSGANDMLVRIRDMLHHIDPKQWEPIWQRLSDEMVKFADDYQNGTIGRPGTTAQSRH
jgi:hypothetical protein